MTIKATRSINVRTLVPVKLADGKVVGYFAFAYGFIPKAQADQPNFDVETLRAKRYGGCEPQIGDESIKQKYPVCPAATP